MKNGLVISDSGPIFSLLLLIHLTQCIILGKVSYCKLMFGEALR